jgi:RNA recognition motif-containing protein
LFVTKIYVGNLPFSATEAQVRYLFAAHGTVDKVSLVNDRETGRPRGFGFVEMPNADATRAMQALDGKDFGGRPLKVNEAQERDRGAPRGNFGGGGGRRFSPVPSLATKFSGAPQGRRFFCSGNGDIPRFLANGDGPENDQVPSPTSGPCGLR